MIVFVCNAFDHLVSPLGVLYGIAIAGRRRSCNRRRKHEQNVLPDCVCALFSLVFMLNLEIAGNGRCDHESGVGFVVSWRPLWEGRPRGDIFCWFFPWATGGGVVLK